MSDEATVCEIGGVDDGTLRVCCSAHGKTLCAKHYAVTHFVEVGPEAEAKPCVAYALFPVATGETTEDGER